MNDKQAVFTTAILHPNIDAAAFPNFKSYSQIVLTAQPFIAIIMESSNLGYSLGLAVRIGSHHGGEIPRHFYVRRSI
jgi:hypothetical protein